MIILNKKKVIIIGAGIGGLATAARLAKYGYHVTVIEKNAEIVPMLTIFRSFLLLPRLKKWKTNKKRKMGVTRV